MNRIRAELSVLSLYSQLGVERPTGLLDTRLVPQLASEALVEDPASSDDLLPLAMLSTAAPPIDIVETLIEVSRSWHGEEFLRDEDQVRWSLTLYWIAVIANENNSDPFEVVRLIRLLGCGEGLRAGQLPIVHHASGRAVSATHREVRRIWTTIDSAEHRHDEFGEAAPTELMSNLGRKLLPSLVNEELAWIARPNLRYFRPLPDPVWF